MPLSLIRPCYRCKPIMSLAALARALRLSVGELHALAERAHKRYRTVKPEPGSTRQTFDALGQLKEVHRRIKEVYSSTCTSPNTSRLT